MSVGIRISQPGYDARKCADYQFVFNSDWPSLACAFDKTVTLGPSASLTIPHGLIFVPFVVGEVLVSGVSYGRIFAPSQTAVFKDTYAHYPQSAFTLSWDKTNIYLTNNDGANSYTANVKAYNLDISKAVNYTLPKYPTANYPYDPSFGIKVSKAHQDVRSKDLRNFILHSRAQSPAVLSIVTGNSGTGTTSISYSNPVGYLPWVFAFYVSGGKYFGLAPGSQQSGAIFKLGKNITLGSTTIASGAILSSTVASVALSLVVLRDPLVAASTVNVSY